MKKPSFLFLACAATASLISAFAAAPAASGGKPDQTSPLFDGTNVLHIQVEIGPEALQKLKKYEWRFGPQSDRENVPVTVREGGTTFTNVALHLKGSAGSFRPVTDNPAMTLNFDKSNSGQKFHGLTKLSLNNSVQDPTFISEQFSRELFLKAGVPVPRATQVTVELNGRDLGVYVLVEGFNKQFLKRHFKNPNGHLYDGGFVKDIDAELVLNSGENPKDQSDRLALVAAARESDPDKQRKRLDETLDVNRFISCMALDTILANWDGYSQNRNNWRLYHDPESGKMVFMPHGLDQMLSRPDESIIPPLQGMVSKAVLKVPEFRARYFARLKELRQSVFQVEPLTNRVRALSAKIQPVLQKKDPDRARDQERASQGFADLIVRRARSLDDQLSVPLEPIKFDAAGLALPSQWNSKLDFGRPLLSRTNSPGHGISLQLGTEEGSSIGTWRSQIWLEAGRYRVETRVKTEGIVADLGDPRGGAGIRVGRERSTERLLGSNDWKTLAHDFTLDDGLSAVQIVCEFRGTTGAATFEDIRLVRLPDKEK